MKHVKYGADIHLNPGDLLKTKIDVLLGDGINVLPWGIRAWQTEAGRRTIESIASRVETYVEGNHDYLKALQKLFKDYPQVKIMKQYAAIGEERLIIGIHSHRQAPDWNILSRIAPWAIEQVTRWGWSRNLWYRFCRWKGWIPGKDGTRKVIRKSSRKKAKFNKWFALVRTNVMDKINDQPTIVYIGHTHYRYREYDPNTDCTLVNLGANEILDVEEMNE